MRILVNHHAPPSIKQEARYDDCLHSNLDTVTSCVNLVKYLNFSVPQTGRSSIKRDKFGFYLIRFLRRLNGSLCEKCFEWYFIPSLRIFLSNLQFFLFSVLSFSPSALFQSLEIGATTGCCCFRTFWGPDPQAVSWLWGVTLHFKLFVWGLARMSVENTFCLQSVSR